MRFVAVLDGTAGGAVRQSRALGGFLNAGQTGHLTGETLVLYHDAADRDRLLELAPTRDVRLVRVPARRPDRALDALTATACDASSDSTRSASCAVEPCSTCPVKAHARVAPAASPLAASSAALNACNAPASGERTPSCCVNRR